jgi:regulator of sigma E protease
MLVFIGFILILLLVVAHEAGHFFAARRNGIEVEEFGIGFPPKAKTLGHKNGTEYTLNWLPLGGFVKLKGEHDADTTPGSFGAAKLIDKVKVMVAGVAVNFFIAFLLFTIIALIGMPQLVENQFTVANNETVNRQDVLVGFIGEGSPAEKAGLEVNDVIKSLDNGQQCIDYGCYFEIKEAGNPDDVNVGPGLSTLNEATRALAGQDVTVTVVRNGETIELNATLLDAETVEASKDTDDPKGYLGVVPSEFSTKSYTWAAPIVGLGTTAQFTELTLKGLGSIVSGLFRGDTEAATEQVSGVVGVGFIFSSASFLGPIFMLMIVAVISLSLAIMNLLPIPALDGGRLFVTLLFRAMKKPLTKETEERIHGTGFAALMILFVLITVVDVQRFIL